jgi:hypothetical protein
MLDILKTDYSQTLYFYHFYHGPVPVVVLGFDFYEFSEGVLN